VREPRVPRPLSLTEPDTGAARLWMSAMPGWGELACVDRPRGLERKGKPVRIEKAADRTLHRLDGIYMELRTRLLHAAVGDEGMSTAEYAIGTIAAAAFGAVLYGVVTGDSIVNALTKIIDRALNTTV
jgi:hypothetical protein